MSYPEIKEYRKFTKPAELHKALNTLKGIVAGITMEGGANESEMNELINWCVLHKHLENRHPFSELIPLIYAANEDGVIDSEEAKDILWLCNNFIVNCDYYNAVTSGLQYLSGLLHGLLADNELSDKEIELLFDWMQTNDFMRGCYPYDEIDSLLVSAKSDGVIDEKERMELMAFFSEFVDISTSYNLNQKDLDAIRNEYSIVGICAVDPEINLSGNTFCFTGTSDKASRNEIAECVLTKGGIFSNTVSKKVNYLIVGNSGNPCWAYSCYGRKVEQAKQLRKDGHSIAIVNETDFWDMF